MKIKDLILISLIVGGCASPQRQAVYEQQSPLDEVVRAGALRSQKAIIDRNRREYPTQNQLVQQVCVSEPLFDAWGRYYRTAVRCW